MEKETKKETKEIGKLEISYKPDQYKVVLEDGEVITPTPENAIIISLIAKMDVKIDKILEKIK